VRCNWRSPLLSATAAVAAGLGVDPARWRVLLDQVMARIAGRFGRVEPRATAGAYVLGLLSATERKNCWQLAEQAGHPRPGPMQRLLRCARWDADPVRDDVRAYVVDHLGDDGVLIVDETGFGRKAACRRGCNASTPAQPAGSRLPGRRVPRLRH
jgi:DDE superfamily endonuclease